MNDSLDCVNSIFEQPWWLDAVAPGKWDCVEVLRNGVCVGRLTYAKVSKYGMRYYGTPEFSMFSGPWIKDTQGKHVTMMGYKKEIMNELIDMLPHGNIQLWLSPENNYYLPFLWKGFQVQPCFTYRIDDTLRLKTIWDNLDKTARKAVIVGRRELIMRDDLSIDVLIEIVRKTYLRQNRKYIPEKTTVSRLYDACLRHNAGKLMCAVDKQGRVHTATLYVYDKKAVYAVLGGSDPELRSSQSASFIIWKGIELASEMGVAFDFEGSSVESIEKFFRSFGGTPLIYYKVSRLNPFMSFAEYMKPKIKRAIGYKYGYK